MKFLTSAAFVFTAIGLASSASAIPVGQMPTDSGLATKVAGGCGPGWHPNRWGQCVPNRYGPPGYGGGPPPPGYYGGGPLPPAYAPGYGGGLHLQVMVGDRHLQVTVEDRHLQVMKEDHHSHRLADKRIHKRALTAAARQKARDRSKPRAL